MKKPELLSPAGDLARLKTAIRYGADAVYIGGTSFSLRARASNFTLDDIKEACEFAHMHGARVHVTVNMIPHEEDFEGFAQYVEKLQDFGVTAAICASPAYMEIIREKAPRLEIHCSTQLSIHNVQAARFYAKNLGVSRVVLARECSMDEVRSITRECGIETEAFIHGGMCVSYSGRCVLSNRMTLRDANRGGCAQSCRWQYHVFDGNKELSSDVKFTMGSKDLCAVNHVYSLMEAGVDSFKIEGRMKTEYYVASIVSAYRALIDAIYENQGPLESQALEWHRAQVLKGENRRTWGGFYDNPGGEDSLIYQANSNADVSHDFLGTIVGREGRMLVVETRNPFSQGEEVELLCRVGQKRFTLGRMIDGEGCEIERSRHPMALVKIETDVDAEVGDLLRRAR